MGLPCFTQGPCRFHREVIKTGNKKDAGAMLAQRLRRWRGIKPAPDHGVVFSWCSPRPAIPLPPISGEAHAPLSRTRDCTSAGACRSQRRRRWFWHEPALGQRLPSAGMPFPIKGLSPGDSWVASVSLSPPISSQTSCPIRVYHKSRLLP